MSRCRYSIYLLVFLLPLLSFRPVSAAAGIPPVWVTRDILSFPNETITAGPRVATSVSGDIYMAVATHKLFKENCIYILHSSDGFSWSGFMSPVYSYPTGVSRVCRLDFAVTGAGFHVVWDDGNCGVHHLFISPDGQQKVATQLTGSGGQPVLLKNGDRITIYYLKKLGFGYYPLVVWRSWAPEQQACTEEAEVLRAGGSYQYASPSAALSTSGQVYLSAVYYIPNQNYNVHVANLTEASLSSIAATQPVAATATLATGPQVQVFWGEQNGCVEGRLYGWSGGEKAAVVPGVLKTNQLRAHAPDGAVHLLWYDIGQGQTGALKYTFGEGSDFADPMVIDSWSTTGTFAGLDLVLASGNPLIFWAADRWVKQSYPLPTAASVAAFTYTGRELPDTERYYYYPGAAQNNVLRLKVVAKRPLPDGLYADPGKLGAGTSVEGETEDGGFTYLIEWPLPDATPGVYPIIVREGKTGTELARFEAAINLKPDLMGFDGETTEWTSIEDFTRADVVLHREGRARIAFTGIDLTTAGVSEIVYLGDYLDLTGTGVLVFDTEALPTFQHLPARVTFYGLPYTSAPEILVNGQPAGDLITDIAYTPPEGDGGGVLSFNTAHFSTLAAVPLVEVSWPADGAVVGVPRCTVVGTVNDPGAVVQVSVGGTVYTAPAGEGGAWALDVPLEAGENLLRITAVASVGEGLVSPPRTLRVTYPGDRSANDGGVPGEDPPPGGDGETEHRRSQGRGDRNRGVQGNDAGAVPAAEVISGGARPIFCDVTGHWAQEAIEELAARGWVRGVGAGRFAPDPPLTRAEMVMVCLRLLGISEAVPVHARFTDVPPGSWYYAPVEAACRAGLVAGLGDGRFAPERPVTRQETAVILLRVLEKAGAGTVVTAGERERLLGSFMDGGIIAPWAREAVAGAVKLGLVHGRPDQTFAPTANTTRAEAAVVVWRVLKLQGLIR